MRGNTTEIDTPSDIHKLKSELSSAKKSNDLKYYQRLRVILAIASEGRTIADAADRCDAPYRSAQNWIHRYKRGGLQALRNRPGPGRPQKLSPTQCSRLREVIDRDPKSAGIDSPRWTSALIAKWIACEFDIRYSVSQVHRMIKKSVGNISAREERR